MALRGAWLILPAVALSLATATLTKEWPWPVVLPARMEGVRGFLIVAGLWTSVMMWAIAVGLLAVPAGTRRMLSISGFASALGIRYMQHAPAPAQRGLLFAEGDRAPAASRPRRMDAAGSDSSLFRAEHAIGQAPAMQVAIARYVGSKNDPKAPRSAFRFLELQLLRPLPHIFIDARGGGSIRSLIPGTQVLSLEGDFDRYFTVYVPVGYERDALQLLTPDVMACLIDHGRGWDIEIVDDRLIVASPRVRVRHDRTEYTALLLFAELIGGEVGDQALTYTDPRAELPKTQVAAPGSRLARRSAVWGTVAFAVAVVVMLGYPWVLGWFLDR